MVPLAEAAVAVAVVLAPGAWPAQVALVALFAVFAIAGLGPLLRGGPRTCACFGATTREAALGCRQILQLLPVLVLALLLGRVHAPWDGATGAVALGGSLRPQCT